MSIDKADAEEKFDDFLMVMDDQLEALADEAFKRGITLDFSLDDCEQLEHLFDAMSAEIDEDTKSSLVVTFARHLGEIVRLRFGGKWHLPLDDENNVYFNTPVLVGHSTMKDLEFAPTFVMRGYALRKKAGSLRRAIDADINIKPLDLSHLPDE
jgi:hypothetical protein